MQQQANPNYPFVRNSQSFSMAPPGQPQQPFIQSIPVTSSPGPQFQFPLTNNHPDSKNTLYRGNSAINLFNTGTQQVFTAVKNLISFGSNHSLGSLGHQFNRPKDDSLYYEQKTSQWPDDEKLEIADLDSKSSESSDGVHFEITEARKKSQIKAKYRNVSQPPTAPKGGLRDLAAEQAALDKVKEAQLNNCMTGNQQQIASGEQISSISTTIPISRVHNSYGSINNFLKMDPPCNFDQNDRPRLQSLMSGNSQLPNVNALNQQESYHQMDASFGSMNFLLPEQQTLTQPQPHQGFQMQQPVSVIAFKQKLPVKEVEQIKRTEIQPQQKDPSKQKVTFQSADQVLSLQESQYIAELATKLIKIPAEKPKKRVRKAVAKQKDSSDAAHKKQEVSDVKKVKHRNQITKCPHVDGVYYASGMCKNCYHSKGRNKLATKCEHTDRKLYARGICKACYLREYHNRTRSALDSTASPMLGPMSCPTLPKLPRMAKRRESEVHTLPLFDSSAAIAFADASREATFELATEHAQLELQNEGMAAPL